MPRKSAPPTLGSCLSHRRRQLGLTQAEAALRADVARRTWFQWEKGVTIPNVANWPLIDDACEWERGSVAAVLGGGAPTPRRTALASVTQLRPADAGFPPDDETVTELRAMFPPGPTLNSLITAYWAEKRDDDTRRRERYLGIAREANG